MASGVLTNEQWEHVTHHFTIALEICQEAGLSEEDARDEFDNALENVYPSEPDNLVRQPKPEKKS